MFGRPQETAARVDPVLNPNLMCVGSLPVTNPFLGKMRDFAGTVGPLLWLRETMKEVQFSGYKPSRPRAHV